VTDSTNTTGPGDNAYGQPDMPDPNQEKNEPIGTSPTTSAQAGEASRASMDQGVPPRPIETDDEAGAEQMRRSAAPPADGGVPTPGDAQGVAVPSVQAAAGTSEQSHAAEGVKTTSLAPPGKPDGEVDTRPEAPARLSTPR
jgi:hypothetical protein